jgi:peptidoglycan/LPS O-acetylase OafA/YrhL
MNWKAWPEIRRRGWIAWTPLALGGLGLLCYESYREITKTGPVNGDLRNAGSWAYALGAPMLILSGITLWKFGSSVRRALRQVGEYSLQLYLIHPILLLMVTSRPRAINLFKWLPVPSLWLFAFVTLGTFAIALILDRVPFVNQVLFGREAPRRKPMADGDGLKG